MKRLVRSPSGAALVAAMLFAAGMAAMPLASLAASTVIYRCTDAKGHLTMQNDTPCPKSSKQDKQVIEAPVVIPSYVSPPDVEPAPPPVPVPEPVAAPTAPPRPDSPRPLSIADADRLPPPPIYQCNTWENDTYLSEAFDPKPRCVRMQTTGLAGDPDNGVGEACEMKYDLCWRVADEKACDGWKRRQREIESTWRFAAAGQKQALQDEFARVTRILNDTTCSAP